MAIKGYIVHRALLLSFPKAYHVLGGHALSWNHRGWPTILHPSPLSHISLNQDRRGSPLAKIILELERWFVLSAIGGLMEDGDASALSPAAFAVSGGDLPHLGDETAEGNGDRSPRAPRTPGASTTSP